MPLGRHKEITAKQLISDLRTEAMKQKQKTKRNPFKTGLYKYVMRNLENNQNKLNFFLVVNKIDRKVINKNQASRQDLEGGCPKCAIGPAQMDNVFIR